MADTGYPAHGGPHRGYPGSGGYPEQTGRPVAAAQAHCRLAPRTSPTRTPGARIRWGGTRGPGSPRPSRWHRNAGSPVLG